MTRLVPGAAESAAAADPNEPPGDHAGSASTRRRTLLIVALVLTGLSMRTAVTSVGAVLDPLQADLHMSGGVAGIVTTLPVLCFAGLGAVAPRLAHRHGSHRLVVASLVAMTVGLVARAVVSNAWAFIALSFLALAGGAIANILMPSLVKRHFPDRIGAMTSVYTTAMAIGMTASAGLTVPIGSLGDGWRTGLASWALFSAVAVVPWLSTLRADRPIRSADNPRPAVRLVRSRVAWAITLLFAFQSYQAYVAFGWFAKFFSDHGYSENAAGWLVAGFAAVQIPVSVIVPNLVVRRPRPLICVLGACALAAYVGMLTAPAGGAWLWMVLAGTGGGLFPTALTLIGLRARTAETTAALSAFVQAVGYIVAGSGPLLVGLLHDSSGSWTGPLISMLAALALTVSAGWYAASSRYVDDEIGAADRAAPAHAS